MKTVTVKIGNMRKPQEFVVYPNSNDSVVVVQSDTCYARINPTTGNARFVNRPGGARAEHLLSRGQDIHVPADIVQQFIAAIPKSGDRIFGNAGFIA